MRTSYYEYSDPRDIIARIAEIAPRTVIFDVEPLIAYWDTDTLTLDEGISRYVAEISIIPSIRVVTFATNSRRHPSALPHQKEFSITYHSAMQKPFRKGPFLNLPTPGVVVGDQIATDGILALRLDYCFIRYRVEGGKMKLGSCLMAGIEWPIKTLAFSEPEKVIRKDC